VLDRGLRLDDPAGSADLLEGRPRPLEECPTLDLIVAQQLYVIRAWVFEL
jgi:hypothetical protein